MPLKILMPSTAVPRTLPADVSTIAPPSSALRTLNKELACVPASSNDVCLRKLRRLVIEVVELSLPPLIAAYNYCCVQLAAFNQGGGIQPLLVQTKPPLDNHLG